MARCESREYFDEAVSFMLMTGLMGAEILSGKREADAFRMGSERALRDGEL